MMPSQEPKNPPQKPTLATDQNSGSRFARTHTFRTRLWVNMILLIVAPVLVIGIVSSILYFRNAREQVLNQLDSIASLKEAEINAWVSNLKTNLNFARPTPDQTWIFSSSLNTDVTQGNGDQFSTAVATVTANLKNIVAQSQVFNNLSLLNTQGKIFISTDESLLNVDQVAETYYKEGLNGLYISSLQPVSTPEGETKPGSILVLSTPVLNPNGETVGVLVGYASQAKLNEIMFERSGLGQTGETFLVSPKLALLTDSRFEGYTAGKIYPFDQAITHALVNQTNGKSIYHSYRGATVVGAYRWLPGLNILLVAENAQMEAMMSAFQTIGINLGILALVFLVALGIGWYSTQRMTNPLSNLAKTAKAIAAGDLTRRAEVNQNDEVGSLAQLFNQMTDQLGQLLQGLEQRVSERNRDVERRSMQLQVAVEIAREATATRDLVELLNKAVNLVNEYFGFYHAGIFLIDERGEYAVLRAATGDVGQQMLRDGHKLEVNKSENKYWQRTVEHQGVVGYVTWSGVARIVSDVETDPIYFKNPLLPATRSEVALPLRVGNQIIGVLDSQSTDKGAFTEDNVHILQTMADLLAIAIDNARLFQDMNQTVRELETVYGKYTREAWISLKNRKQETHGEALADYRYRGLMVEKAEIPNPEAEEALKTGHTVVVEQPQSALAIPLRLRGQTVGVVNLRFEGQGMPVEMVTTYEEIANRLVLVLENARLLQEAQQLARREQQINAISTRIRSSATTDSILRNTVRELGTALGASRTFIQLGTQISERERQNLQDMQLQGVSNGLHPSTEQETVKTSGDSKEPRE